MAELECSIRFWQVDDARSLFDAAWQSREQIGPWLPWCHGEYEIGESTEWLRRQVKAREQGIEYQFAVIADGSEVVGGCGLNAIDSVNRRANLGYWLRTSHTGRGLASRATGLVAAWAFANTELLRLEVVVSAENLGSLRAAEKAGAEREGLLRSRIFLHGRAHDAVSFSIVRSRWRNPAGSSG